MCAECDDDHKEPENILLVVGNVLSGQESLVFLAKRRFVEYLQFRILASTHITLAL